MGKFEQVTAALEALPADRREEIGAILEMLFHGDLHPNEGLTDAQMAEVQARLANPGPLATDAEVEAFFERFNG
ncbi:MAG: hypothetical protein ACOYKM_13830 [Caulobacterales bacterium]|jgi:hypothetical protein